MRCYFSFVDVNYSFKLHSLNLSKDLLIKMHTFLNCNVPPRKLYLPLILCAISKRGILISCRYLVQHCTYFLLLNVDRRQLPVLECIFASNLGRFLLYPVLDIIFVEIYIINLQHCSQCCFVRIELKPCCLFLLNDIWWYVISETNVNKTKKFALLSNW